MSSEQSYSIDDLCVLVGLTRRTVRYYVQMGLLDRPQGQTRSARYFQRHVDELLTIKKYVEMGLSLERIRMQMEVERFPQQLPAAQSPGSVQVWSHVFIADGIELAIDPKSAQLTPQQLRELVLATIAALQSIRKEEP